MRAVVCRRWGKPEDLTFEDTTLPELQPDQLRVQIKAAGVSLASSLAPQAASTRYATVRLGTFARIAVDRA